MKQKVKDFKKNRASKRITKLSEAQSLLSRYIQMYEKNEITDNMMRTLAYACKTYAEISKIQYLEEIETRLVELEKRSTNEKRF
jgi:hypothetical protein